MTARATCRLCRRSPLIKLPRSSVRAPTASASLSWPAGACRAHRNTAARRSPTSAMSSPHWRGWLGARNCCVAPATSFCEYADTKPRKTPIWLALAEDRPSLRVFRSVGFLARRARSQERSGPGRASALRLPDDGGERNRRADSPEGDACDPDDAAVGGSLLGSARHG